MPFYCYRCRDCRKSFEVRHGMFFEGQRCIHCKSEDVFREPQGSLRKKEVSKPVKPGKIVDKYIKDVKEEINKEKDKLKSEEF